MIRYGALCAISVALSAAEVKASMPSTSDFAKSLSTLCRYVPERADDFAWENDVVAFRAYGPALRAHNVEDSGIDCWPKRVDYPIVNRWYAGMLKGLSYHDDRGEGCDQYHVGRSRGCGGTALWLHDQLVTPGPYRSWHIEECGKERSTFTLTYDYPANPGEEVIHETKQFTIALGDPWFTCTSTWTRGDKPLVGQPVVVGITTHDDRGTVSCDPHGRWAAVWEDIKPQNTGFIGTGMALPANANLREIHTPQQPDTSHVIALLTTNDRGSICYRAGFALVRAGHITTLDAWQQALAKAAAGL